MKTIWRSLMGKAVLLLILCRLAGAVVASAMRDWSAVAEAAFFFGGGLVAGGAVLGSSYRNRLASDSFMRLLAGTFAIVSVIALVLGTGIAFAHSSEEWWSSFVAAGILPIAVWMLIKVKDGSRQRMFQPPGSRDGVPAAHDP